MNKHLIAIALLVAAGTVSAQSGAPTAKPGPDAAAPMSEADEVAKTRSEMAADDTDKDGKISVKEFLVRHTEAFNRMDLNRDGSLTPEEFVAFRRQLIEANRKQMENIQKGMNTPR